MNESKVRPNDQMLDQQSRSPINEKQNDTQMNISKRKDQILEQKIRS